MPDTRADPPLAHAHPNFAHDPARPPACRTVDPELFYPPPDHHGPLTAAAKATCRRCPVRAECLDWAIDTDQRHGIWGAMTVGERDRERGRRQRRQRLAPPAACPGPGACPAADAGYTHDHVPGAAQCST